MPDMNCRVAKLEEQVKTLYENSSERRRQADRTNELLEDIRDNLQSEITALKKEISEMKGFGNGLKTGALMMAGLLSSGITVLIDRIFSH